jgi:hypothetical protein
MEGKLVHVKTLNHVETQRVFKMMMETNDLFISVNKNSDQTSELEMIRSQLFRMKKFR